MPSSSQAQNGLMAMASTSYGRKKLQAEGKKAPPQSVAQEFTQADKGKAVAKLPRHVPRAKK